MMLADVNIYVNAFRPEALDHQPCRVWLEQLLAADSAFAVSPQVLSSFVRVATNRRVFKPPSLPQEAFAFCRHILDHPRAVVVQPGERHWSIFERLCLVANAHGTLVPDAWFAALAIEHGCEWITLDRDFSLFPQLNWNTPKGDAR